MDKKPAKTSKTIRLSEIQQQEFVALYGSVYAGATQSAEAYLSIRTQTLKELKGKFTRNEWFCMIDSIKGTTHITEYQDNVGIFEMQMNDYDGQYLDMVTNYRDFMYKLHKTTSAQVYFIQDEIYRYWNNEQIDIDTFIAKFL